MADLANHVTSLETSLTIAGSAIQDARFLKPKFREQERRWQSVALHVRSFSIGIIGGDLVVTDVIFEFLLFLSQGQAGFFLILLH